MLYIQATSSGVLNQQKSFSLSQLALQDRRLLFHYTSTGDCSQNNLLDKLFGFGLLVFCNLGKDPTTKSDEFLEKFQTIFL